MRLKDHEIQAIRKAAVDLFGPDAEVWLFGSRVDDAKRGGDIDLMVSLSGTDAHDAVHLSKQRVRYLVALEKILGERRIDLVTAWPGDERPIVRVAKDTGVRL